jgi:hypothetical protein
MAFYAMLVVVEADLVTEAQQAVEGALTTPASLKVGIGPVKFVGTPWQVQPLGKTIRTPVADYAVEFDTLEMMRQHPIGPVDERWPAPEWP